jgi:putative phosphoribosyl transferase
MGLQRDTSFETGVLFHDRADAGRVLSGLLAAYRGGDVVVLGIPRGGVLVAAEVARHLDADLDVIVARKIATPRAGEVSLGSVTACGGLYLDQRLIRNLAVPEVSLDAAVAAQMDEARRREARYRDGRAEPVLRGRTVLLVDDGLAGGAAMVAAARAVRLRKPAHVTAAVPVGSREACLVLVGEVDEIVCPYVPDPFTSTGAFYARFESVHDAVVEQVLRERSAGVRTHPARATSPPRPAQRVEP